MRLRLHNPTPTQWAVIMAAGAFTLGLGATAYAAGRRRRLPSVDEPVPTPTPSPQEWVVVSDQDPGYPWEFPALHFDNYPTPGTWIDLGDKTGAFDPAQGFDTYVRALLGSALAMAGNDPGIAFAQGQDPRAELGRRLRREVRKAITVVGGVNDLAYGQTNLNFAGGNDPNAPGGDPAKPFSGAYVLNEEGRGLNWLPRHADNLQRIADGLPLKRTTSLTGQPLPWPDGGNRQMALWSPAFDLAPLAPGQPDPAIRFLQWSDGSSTIDPPPSIQALGVDLSGVELPGVAA